MKAKATWFSGALALALSTVLSSGALAPTPVQAAVDNDLINPSFEDPVIKGSYSLIPISSGVPGWQTTDTHFEIWKGSLMGDANGIGAYAGKQYAELNAYKPGTLFQDIATTPGQTLRWRLAHRPRGTFSTPDVMRVLAAAPSGQLLPLVPDERDGEPWKPTGSGLERADISDGGKLPDGSYDVKWHVWSGTYVVPAGQTKTRFAFQAVSSGYGVLGAGNFLDAIEFGQFLPTEYTLTYDANGGQCSAAAQTAIEKTAVVVNDGATCSRVGYVFQGWNALADGKGDVVSAASTFVLQRNQTLFAVWAPINDSFTYQVCAPDGGPCETATVFIALAPPPEVREKNPVVLVVPPLANTPIVFTPGGPQDPTSVQPPANPGGQRSLTIAKLGANRWGNRLPVPNKGTWVVKNGSVRFRPNANFYGRVSIQVRIISTDGSVQIQTLTAARAAVPGTINGGKPS